MGRPKNTHNEAARYLEGISKSELHSAFSASSDPRATLFLSSLDDSSTHALALTCQGADLSVDEVVEIVRHHRVSMATLQASQALPTVLEEAIRSAGPSRKRCGGCAGRQQIRAGKDEEGNTIWALCPVCDGAGYLLADGDHRARRDVMEAAGAVRKGPATQVNIGLGLSLEGVVKDAEEKVPMGAVDIDAQEVDS